MVSSSPPKHILIVEDDKDIRDSLVELLQAENFQVSSASNGQEAINWLLRQEKKPHLILLDLMMPIKDGFQFRIEQKQYSQIADIPVVVMSADGRVNEKKALLQAAAYLHKPVDIEEIISTVRTFCA